MSRFWKTVLVSGVFASASWLTGCGGGDAESGGASEAGASESSEASARDAGGPVRPQTPESSADESRYEGVVDPMAIDDPDTSRPEGVFAAYLRAMAENDYETALMLGMPGSEGYEELQTTLAAMEAISQNEKAVEDGMPELFAAIFARPFAGATFQELASSEGRVTYEVSYGVEIDPATYVLQDVDGSWLVMLPKPAVPVGYPGATAGLPGAPTGGGQDPGAGGEAGDDAPADGTGGTAAGGVGDVDESVGG